MKKILILAGSHFQVPVIEYARKRGYYVITCDNRPDNPGHALADKYVNVSTTDMPAVLQAAQEDRVDGILAYASDPAAPTAAYVAEKLGLPGNSIETVSRLGIKSNYRRFLRDNGFNCPGFVVLKDGEYSEDKVSSLRLPVMVKPVDSAGSKGVSRATSPQEIPQAIKDALVFSRQKEVVIEEVIEKDGYQIGGEAYVYKGELVMMCLGDQRVNAASAFRYVPIGMTFPAQLTGALQVEIRSQLQLCIKGAGFQTGALNLEIMKTADGKVYLMEIGPRSGGNLLPELMKYTCGFDVAGYSVEHALGNDVVPKESFSIPVDYFAYYAMHSREKGIFHGIKKDPSLGKNILEEHIFLKPGQEYDVFMHSGYVIGIWLLRYGNRQNTERFFDDPYKFYKLN